MPQEEGEGGPEGRSNRSLLAVILSAVFVSVLTQSLVNVVVPVIEEDFGASEGQVGWVITGYLLVFAVGIPLYGRVSPAITGAFLAAHREAGTGAMNPLYSLDAPSFSDTFLLVAAILPLALAASLRLRRSAV